MPLTIWFTGLSGSGKTTIAQAVAKKLKEKNIKFVLIDGNEFRKIISPDLGYSLKDRNKNMQRVADICKAINDHGSLALAAVLSPTQQSRDYARTKINKMIEVYTKCSFNTLEKRDIQGFYKKFKEGKMKELVGKDLGYEEPKNSDLILDTDKLSIEECADKIIEKLNELLWKKIN